METSLAYRYSLSFTFPGSLLEYAFCNLTHCLSFMNLYYWLSQQSFRILISYVYSSFVYYKLFPEGQILPLHSYNFMILLTIDYPNITNDYNFLEQYASRKSIIQERNYNSKNDNEFLKIDWIPYDFKITLFFSLSKTYYM